MKKILFAILISILMTIILSILFNKYFSDDLSKNIQKGESFISEIPFLKKTVCDKTLEYSIGNFDDRFGITEEDFLLVLKESENVWEREMNLDLFRYNPEAPFRVNLVFDERQQQSMESEELTGDYEKLIEVQGEISDEYRALESKYNFMAASYNKEVKEYESDVKEYNKEVEDWNREGGAPPDEYKKLGKKSKELKKRFEDLQDDVEAINFLASQINELAKKEKQLVSEYNENIETYRDRYGESQEFNQGEYNQGGITIYQFRGKKDLVLVLAHEFGHALNVGHTADSRSVMYYLMENQDLENVTLTQDDIKALETECKIE